MRYLVRTPLAECAAYHGLDGRGLKQIASARTIVAGHAFVQSLRRGHYELTADLPAHDRVRVAFAELALSP